jgi:anti-anti-sigma regulatory factor
MRNRPVISTGERRRKAAPMSTLPSWLVCRPDEGDYARVLVRLRILTFDQAPHLSSPLAECILGMGRHSALVDLSTVEYLSSDVVAALLHLSRTLREAGGRVVLVNADPLVRTVFTPFPERQKPTASRPSTSSTSRRPRRAPDRRVRPRPRPAAVAWPRSRPA